MTDREKVIKPVRGYEGLYAVDNFANIYSVRRNMKMLAKQINPSGYEVVSLCRGGTLGFILGVITGRRR